MANDGILTVNLNASRPYYLYNVLADGSMSDITQLVKRLRWSGDLDKAARDMTATLLIGDGELQPKYIPPLGSILLLTGIAGEITRSVVFKFEVDKGNQILDVTTHDHLYYLNQSKGTYIFRGMTPEAIITQLCGEFGIPIGVIHSTGITLEKLILRDKTIYEMMLIAVTEASKRTGVKYLLKMAQGKLTLIRRGTQQHVWRISKLDILTDATYSESIESMRNRIVVMGDKDEVLATAEDTGLISSYGLLQELTREDKDITAGDAQTIAAQKLTELGKIQREIKVEAIGLDDVQAGDMIEVLDTTTSEVKRYYVLSDDHELEGGKHTMSLELSMTDDLPWTEASDEETEEGED